MKLGMLVPLEELLLKDNQDGSISVFFRTQFRRKVCASFVTIGPFMLSSLQPGEEKRSNLIFCVPLVLHLGRRPATSRAYSCL